MSSTETLTRPDEDTDTGTKPPEMFHFVRKADMARSAVEGTHVVALCGEAFPVTKVPKKSSNVCPECQRLFNMLKP